METYRHDVNIILNELEEVEGKLVELQSENFTDGTISNNVDAMIMRFCSLQDCLLNLYIEFGRRIYQDVDAIIISSDEDDDVVQTMEYKNNES
jgi:hypothetical protein